MPDADYKLQQFHHLHWYVGNTKQAAYYLQTAWGFTPIAYQGLETGSRDVTSIVLQQGKIYLVLTAPLHPDGPVNHFLNRHGEGVHDVAFETDNVLGVYQAALAKGAESMLEPTTLEDENGRVVMATIRAYGDVNHSFIQLDDYDGSFLPGYAVYRGPMLHISDVGLAVIDHVVHNMPEQGMESQVQWYQDKLDFHRYWTVDDKDVATEYSSLRSIVVANANERIKMPVNEPAAGLKKSQIQEFIDYNIDAGVQHVALLTGDILSTITRLRKHGVDFLEVPDSYYDDLADRVGTLEEDMAELKRLRILVDRDDDGYLLQLFTKPVQDRPTFFFEVIQRRGSQSFGKGNFKALFEAIEREQALRGNL